jgi:hypothetical protein
VGTPLTAPGKADFMTDKAYPTVDLHIRGVYPRFLRFLYDLHAIHNRAGVTDIPGSVRLVGGVAPPRYAEGRQIHSDRTCSAVPDLEPDRTRRVTSVIR